MCPENVEGERRHDRRVCRICGYVYDEAVNPPWDSLPDDWKCPLCGASKSDFSPEGGEQAARTALPEVCLVCAHPQSYFEVNAENY